MTHNNNRVIYMETKKIIGITLLMLFAMFVLGGILNGTYLDFGGKHIGYYVGHFTALGALLIPGILCIKKSDKK